MNGGVSVVPSIPPVHPAILLASSPSSGRLTLLPAERSQLGERLHGLVQAVLSNIGDIV